MNHNATNHTTPTTPPRTNSSIAQTVYPQSQINTHDLFTTTQPITTLMMRPMPLNCPLPQVGDEQRRVSICS